MDGLNPTIVQRLRSMAKAGDPPSRILREIIRQSGPAAPHKITLIDYMRTAFRLSLQQASPIAGWGDGTGGLNDLQLDGFLAPEIAKNRHDWESLEAA